MDLENYLEKENYSIEELYNKVEQLEERLLEYKKIEKEQKTLKEKLKLAMEQNDIKSWETLNGTTITLVKDTPDEELEEIKFNEEKFKEENEELYNKYLETTTRYKLGRSGYVKITLGKKIK